MMTKLRTAVVTALACGGLAAAVAVPSFAASARPAATHKVTGGKSSVKLNASARKAMKHDGVTLTPVSPATYHHAKLTSPITGGQYTGYSAKIRTAGGFTLSKGGVSVSITKLHSDSGTMTGTAIVTGHGRIDAVHISIPTHYDVNDNPAKFSGFTVTMTSDLVTILDNAFDTKAFKTHAEIGTGSTSIKYQG
jgi:hypothetical protein